MGLLERIKSALGLGTSGASTAGESTADRRSGGDPDAVGESTPVDGTEGDAEEGVTRPVDEHGGDRGTDDIGDVDVTVEHEPDTRSEDAVKGTDTAGAGPSAEVGPADTGAASDADTADADAADGDAESGVSDAEPGADGTAASEGEPADTEDTEDAAGEGVGLEEVKGIGPAYADRLRDAGVEDVAALAAADAADLAERSDMGEGRLRKLIDRARAR